MTLRINSIAPDFKAETTQGPIEFHKWIGDGWAILFSHPKDFTPVCTTELGYMAGLKPEFDKRNTKIIGLSVDPVTNHSKWAKDIEETQGHAVTYPMIGDPELKVATAYDMLPEGAGTTSDGRTAADNATVRSVFIIGPDKKIKAMLTYPMSSGRNFDEVLRLFQGARESSRAEQRARIRIGILLRDFGTAEEQEIGVQYLRSLVDCDDDWVSARTSAEIALAYLRGQGVKQSRFAAIEWAQHAVTQMPENEGIQEIQYEVLNSQSLVKSIGTVFGAFLGRGKVDAEDLPPRPAQ